MPGELLLDEVLVQRLPLPLAQLYRRAHNAKTALERHLTAYYLWEAGLKLLGAVAIVAYAEQGPADPQLAERLHNLARPSLGHWWEFVRRLVPILAEQQRGAFPQVGDLLLGRARNDLPRAAGLDAALREALDGKSGGGSSRVRLMELFDRLVQYRNLELGHGAAGRRAGDFYERMSRALMAGVGELFGRLDTLAGSRLLYVAEVRQVADSWLVERYELIGETPRRIESVELPHAEASRLPFAGRVYLDCAADSGDALKSLSSLHPLVIYDGDAAEILFLNSRRPSAGKPGRTEYLSYTTGRTVERPDLGSEQRELLARVLGIPVAQEQAAAWANRSQAEEAPSLEPAPQGQRTLGEFELLSELGRGGMGVVYRAWQPSLGRQVALKKLQRSGDAKAEARFAREIHALGRVEHPHLVKIFTSGSDGDQWFYAMELVEGAPLSAVCDRLQTQTASVTDLDQESWHQTLSTVCAEARKGEKMLSASHDGSAVPPVRSGGPAAAAEPLLPPAGRGYVRHIVELVAQAADAAHALHEAGIIHRDIKPGNIMVTADGSQAVLMDLGLAQVADDIDGRLTRTRQFVGTLRYASPQQVLAVGKLNRTTDVYSLGASLWELLALRPLFAATEQTPTPELMEKIQREEPQRLRQCQPGIARDLEAIVHRCLEKAPDRRYATAHELGRDLRRFLNGEPVRARPVSGWERALKWVRRHPATAAVYALVLMVVFLGVVGGGIFSLWRRAENAFADADLARQQAEEEKRQANLARQDADHARQQAELLVYVGNIYKAQGEWESDNFRVVYRYLDACRWDFRSWEHDYLYTLFNKNQRTFRGHKDRVSSVVLSADGNRVISGSLDATARVWDARTGQEALTLEGHTNWVMAVALSADNKRIVTGSKDKTVKVWDARTGQELLTLRHTDSVGGVALSLDGKRIAAASYDHTVKVWDAVTGQETLTFKGHAEGVSCVAFSPDGKHIVSGSYDKTVKVWEADTGQETLTFKGHSDPVYTLAVSSDGNRIVSGSWYGMLKVWDAHTGEVTLSIKGRTEAFFSVALSNDGTRIVSGSLEGTVQVWDSRTGQETLTLKGHTGMVYGVAVSADGNRIVSASRDKTVKVWDATTSQETITLKGHTDSLNSVAVTPDGKHIIGGSRDKTLKVWDACTGQETLTLKGHTDWVNSVAVTPDGKHIVSGSLDKTVKVWDAQTGQETLTLKGHTDKVYGVAVSPDGKHIISGSLDKTVKIWDAHTGQETLTLKGHTDRVNSVAVSPDGKYIVSGSYDKTVKVWDGHTGQETLTLTGHTDSVRSVAVSPDGKRIVSASGDETMKVWDADTGQEILTLKGHTSVVMSVAVSPDGKRIFSGSQDDTVKVWDAATGQETLTLKEHNDSVFCVALSPDGKRIVSGSKNKTVKVWEASTSQPRVLPRWE